MSETSKPITHAVIDGPDHGIYEWGLYNPDFVTSGVADTMEEALAEVSAALKEDHGWASGVPLDWWVQRDFTKWVAYFH
jgi:hypothetical protein